MALVSFWHHVDSFQSVSAADQSWRVSQDNLSQGQMAPIAGECFYQTNAFRSFDLSAASLILQKDESDYVSAITVPRCQVRVIWTVNRQNKKMPTGTYLNHSRFIMALGPSHIHFPQNYSTQAFNLPRYCSLLSRLATDFRPVTFIANFQEWRPPL